MADQARACFHCGEPVPQGSDFTLEIEGRDQPMCCAGCLAVARLIHHSGFGRYYQFREQNAPRAGEDPAHMLSAWSRLDDKQAFWGTPLGDGRYELILQTGGIHCAACSWLIRNGLERHAGIEEVGVDVSSGFTAITWRPDRGRLSTIAERLLALGYRPHLPVAAEEERARREERYASLKRLGVAGLGMMQVMMYAVGLYAGDAQGIEPGPKRFLQFVSLLVTTPVLLYSGRVFVEGAWRGIRAGRAGMDLPVALAIVGAYLASCINFFRGAGEVWFDSVVMFIFFLGVARHVEMSLRHGNQKAGAALARLLPEWAEKLEDGRQSTVAASELCDGDLVRVRSGETFPADGEIVSGSTEVNEALLTGESHPVSRTEGDPVMAGSTNVGQAVSVRVTGTGPDSTVSALGRLLQRARRSRSGVSGSADRYAGRFVLAVLLIAAVTAAYWLSTDPSRALETTLAVLVVSCPCAFSLASPAAVAAASRGLLRRGLILTRGAALEALAGIRYAIFDKTGTLTAGAPTVSGATLNPARTGLGEDEALRIAATLEQYSAHPIASAFRSRSAGDQAEAVEVTEGSGVHGSIAGTDYWLGKPDWVAAESSSALPRESRGVCLADDRGWLASFTLEDGLRDGAVALTARLRREGIGMEILSGDTEAAVAGIAGQLGIERWEGGLTPAAKLERLQALQDEGRVTLMIGDGVNDAPVLAAAGVSISVHSGTEMANAVSDYILTGHSLEGVETALEVARKARRIIRQNLAWAAAYNLVMIPLAVTGALQPWMAAAGMSASSLSVVLNAARLAK